MVKYKNWLSKDFGKFNREHNDAEFEDGEMKSPDKNPKKARKFRFPKMEPHSTGRASKEDKEEAESTRHTLPDDSRIPKSTRKNMAIAVVKRKMKKKA